MNNDYLNINGYSVNYVKSIIKFVTIYYYENKKNELISAYRQMPGDILMFPDNKIVEEIDYVLYLFYDNFSVSTTELMPIPLEVPSNGLSCYVRQEYIEIDKIDSEIILNSSDQTCPTKLIIRSSMNIYFDVNRTGLYSFNVSSVYKQMNGYKEYSCSLAVSGMECMPGQTSGIRTVLNIYSDVNKTNKIAEKEILIIITHESNGSQD